MFDVANLIVLIKMSCLLVICVATEALISTTKFGRFNQSLLVLLFNHL